MITPISLTGCTTVDDILDRLQQLIDDAERTCMSSLLAREQDIDDWDQVLASMAAYRDSTKGWREETRQQLEAVFAEAGRPRG